MKTMLDTVPLHPRFGVEIRGLDLSGDGAEAVAPALRAAFEVHGLILLRGQSLTPDDHLRLARLFGPIEDRDAGERKAGEAFAIPQVSNRAADGGVYDEADLKTLNLKANQLWHTDSTFLPVPALANIITARVVSSTGGETEIASTRAAFEDMPPAMQARLRGAILRHRYAHSRARIAPELAALPMFQKWPDQRWRAVWTNPETGAEAVYIASHACGADGMSDAEAAALIDETIAFCTQPAYVYTHAWRVGDVLIWDERATLHRGRPWPYAEERTLSSLCVSVTEGDGLDTVRPPA
jgi:alpha-ketoglutarate-dependent 2,4-dichlorophenoxyacetate dioxygenase